MATLNLTGGTLQFSWSVVGLGANWDTSNYRYIAIKQNHITPESGASGLSEMTDYNSPTSTSGGSTSTSTYTTAFSAGTWTFYAFTLPKNSDTWYSAGSASVVVQDDTVTGTITASDITSNSATCTVSLTQYNASSVYLYNFSTEDWTRIAYSSWSTSYSYTKTGLTAGTTYGVYLYDSTDDSGTRLDSDTFTTLSVYTLSYDKNGGTGTATGGSYQGGTGLYLASALTKSSSLTITTSFNGNGTTSPSSQTSSKTTNYPFQHWLRSTDSARYSGGAYMTMPYANTTMKAIFGTATYSYTSITLPSMSWSGHRFDGWYTAQYSGTYVGTGGSTYTPTYNSTLYAHWTTLYTYTVAYNANGGSGAPSSDTYGPTPLTSHTFTLNTSTTPTRSGYRFLGWGATSGSTTVITQITCDTSYTSKTVYAIWERISYNYTITYYPNGGTGSSITDTVTGQGSSFSTTLRGQTYTKAYNTQTGWHKSDNTPFSLGESITISSNISLYATWTHDSTGSFYWLGSESADSNPTTGIVQGASVTNMTATAWKTIGTKINNLESLLGDTQTSFTRSMTSGSVFRATYYNEVTQALRRIINNHSLNISAPIDTEKGNRLFYYLFNGGASIKQCLNHIINWYNSR